MTEETQRLQALVESTTEALNELRLLGDPKLTALVQDLERVRADSVARIAEIRSTEHRRPERKTGAAEGS